MPTALDLLKEAAKQTKEEQTKAPQTQADKWKALKGVETVLSKQFGGQQLVRLGKKVGIPMPSLGTGLFTFDYNVVGTGGIPKGRIIEIIGPESSGKTTFALHCVAEEQKRGNICAFVDAEHALDPNYMARLGLDVDNLLVSQPDYGEQALEIVEALVDSQAVSLIVVDSVASLVPKAELEGDMGDSHMGLQARLMSQAMRKLSGKAAKTGTAIIFINQIREKIGVMFGSPETTPGGRALKFYSSLRLDTRKVSAADGAANILRDGQVVGHKVRVKAIKNKVGVPFKSTELNLEYGVGFDKLTDLVNYAVLSGVIKQGGAWFDIPGREDRIQGIKNVAEILRGDETLYNQVFEECKKAVLTVAKEEPDGV